MRRVRLGDGTLIRVREEPEDISRPERPRRPDEPDPPDQVPLFCIHGAGMSSVVWMDLVRRLAPGYHVIAPDLPGHGQSSSRPSPSLSPSPSPSIDGYRDAVLDILAALRPAGHTGPHATDRVVLLGHSMGAAIALRVALFAPDRVAGLVLFNGGARLRVGAATLKRLDEALPRDRFNDDANPFIDRMPEALADLSFSPHTLPDLRARWQAVLLSAPRETILGDFRACDGFDVRGEVPGLRVPVLLIAGEHDLMVPPKILQGTADLIPGARLHLIAATGHLSHLERPEAVMEVLEPFLSSIS